MKDISDVIIIGGGPAGLSAAVYNSRAGLNPLLFAGSPPGGQLMLTTEVENFPGISSILGPQLIESLRAQALSFGTKIIDQNVLKISEAVALEGFIIETAEKKYHTKTILLAMGAKALWLGLDSETRLRGKGVSACATCDGFFFKNKTVAIVGGGDTALEEAQTLTKFANKVYLIHRRSTFRASKIMQDRVFNNNKIEVILENEILEVLGENKVEGLLLKNKYQKNKKLSVDGLFVAIGHIPDTSIAKDIVLTDKKGYILNSLMYGLQLIGKKDTSLLNLNAHYPTMTSKKGIFASGDCVDNIYRQASVASGMGVMASLDIERYLAENF